VNLEDIRNSDGEYIELDTPGKRKNHKNQGKHFTEKMIVVC